MSWDEEARAIYDEIHTGKKGFGQKCNNFTGALTVEVIREHLLRHGLNVSARDVFIKGLPIEIDLLVVRPGAEAEHGILYDPRDVLAVLEVKSRGCFGKGTIDRVKSIFDRARMHCIGSPVYCAYLTLAERFTYKYKVQSENVGGCDAFTMFWHGSTEDNPELTKDWENLVERLCQLAKTAPCG